MSLSTRRIGCGLVGTTAAACVMAAISASAQDTLKTTSSVSVTRQYDSNVFSTPANRDGDFSTRLSPSIESIWKTELWMVTARYLHDIERFDSHPDLSSVDARQQAAVALGYRQSPRADWTANVEFWKTATPGELNEANGLVLMRATARRFSTGLSMRRRATRTVSQTFEYDLTRDQLAGGTGATTHDAVGRIERRQSLRTAIRMDYRFREFRFDAPGGQESQVAAHTVTAGLSRSLTPRTILSIDAGPRFAAPTPSADLRASLGYQATPAEFSVAYARSQTTVIGFLGVAETQSITASIGWPMWSSLRVRIAPALFRSDISDTRLTAAVVGVTITKPMTRDLSLDLDFNANVQHGAVASLARPSIARQVIAIRLVAGAATSTR